VLHYTPVIITRKVNLRNLAFDFIEMDVSVVTAKFVISSDLGEALDFDEALGSVLFVNA